jgi:hypothetical protein
MMMSLVAQNSLAWKNWKEMWACWWCEVLENLIKKVWWVTKTDDGVVVVVVPQIVPN